MRQDEGVAAAEVVALEAVLQPALDPEVDPVGARVRAGVGGNLELRARHRFDHDQKIFGQLETAREED